MAVTKKDLVRQLGATVGDAKAEAAVTAAAREAGVLGELLDDAQAIQILDALGAQPGIVGIAAKLLRVRLVLGGPKG